MPTLEEVIEKARQDPETKEHDGAVYWHNGVGRYGYFYDHRCEDDTIYNVEENVLILFDSGVFKTRIAEMMKISRDRVFEIVDGRGD